MTGQESRRNPLFFPAVGQAAGDDRRDRGRPLGLGFREAREWVTLVRG